MVYMITLEGQAHSVYDTKVGTDVLGCAFPKVAIRLRS